MDDRTRVRLLKLLLRIAGIAMLPAFLTMLMPVEWMAGVHRWAGLGELPRAPVVQYLSRSIAALYGFHGVLVLIVSTDPQKYRAIVTYAAIMNVTFGLMMVAIDLHAAMPPLWTVVEGPPIILFGIVLGWLNRRG